MTGKKLGAAAALETFQVGDKKLYVVGSFNAGVTVYSQQVRALNLAWALVETGVLTNDPATPVKRIAIVGGGFAGLTLAAALLKKGVNAEIEIFERYDTLLPLQHGCDTRWLHPRIYDWPAPDSQSAVALLPVLNWNAARASDVVVQVLKEWRAIVDDPDNQATAIAHYLNTKHLRIHEKKGGDYSVEWIGEQRCVRKTDDFQPKVAGKTAEFDLVVLALGFGLEASEVTSYWRNDALGQPELGRARQLFILSGQGDGAIIDLCRLCISDFRQDRILYELFAGQREFHQTLVDLNERNSSKTKADWFAAFNELEAGPHDGLQAVCDEFKKRLRRDTDVILHLQEKSLGDLFKGRARISFQNRLMLFLLYKCGAFVPSSQPLEELVTLHGLESRFVVRRHGPKADEPMAASLETTLFELLERAPSKKVGKKKPKQKFQPKQEAEIYWRGGYFGYPGRESERSRLPAEKRAYWQREYLPGPTALLADVLCAAIAGAILARPPQHERLRVTLHRAVVIGDVEVLQQCCDYRGTAVEKRDKTSAGRVFPARDATIGAAYRCQKIMRSIENVDPKKLLEDSNKLRLEASLPMREEVNFVMAIPILEPSERYISPSPVAGVLYIDSISDKFWIDNEWLARGLVPTPRALELQERVGALVDEAHTLLRPSNALNLALVERTFTMRTSDGFVENFGPSLLARVGAEAPGIRLNFLQKPDKDSAPLREGRVDLETAVVEPAMGPELRTQALFRDRLIGVIRASHPLARKKISAKHYTEARHVIVSRSGFDEESMEGKLLPETLTRRVASSVGGFATALAVARHLNLVATVPERHTASLREGMFSFPLPVRAPGFSVSLVWHPRLDADQVHRWLRACIRAVCTPG